MVIGCVSNHNGFDAPQPGLVKHSLIIQSGIAVAVQPFLLCFKIDGSQGFHIRIETSPCGRLGLIKLFAGIQFTVIGVSRGAQYGAIPVFMKHCGNTGAQYGIDDGPQTLLGKKRVQRSDG